MKSFLVLTLGIILGAGIIGGVLYLKNNQISVTPKDAQITPVPTVTANEITNTLSPTTNPGSIEPAFGYIEGSLSYPSEGIPANMEICAETIQGVKAKCTSEHIKDGKYQYGQGYKLEVVPGVYFVYANIPGNASKAYYSEFVTCGLKYGCPSHKPIAVTVKPGETTDKVDPQDWYN